ncbi:hypothetical protein C8J56DRAFT_943652 [Mycena floridula]|nr:hypothetical protein C8J56DRAFT_943652 [Mycena floridula]
MRAAFQLLTILAARAQIPLDISRNLALLFPYLASGELSNNQGTDIVSAACFRSQHAFIKKTRMGILEILTWLDALCPSRYR